MKKVQERNWALVITASIVILINLAVLILATIYTFIIGWWSVLLIVGSLSAIILAVAAIKRNEPALLLLDLIFPQ